MLITIDQLERHVVIRVEAKWLGNRPAGTPMEKFELQVSITQTFLELDFTLLAHVQHARPHSLTRQEPSPRRQQSHRRTSSRCLNAESEKIS